MDPKTIRTNKLKFTWGLICLIGPTALIIGTLILYAIVNLATGGMDAESPNTFRTVVNVILYLVGAVSVLTFVPGIVVGIVLLATRK